MDKSRRNFLKGLAFFSLALPLKVYPFPKEEKFASFRHGIASGDPTHSNVILWTKLSEVEVKSLIVRWEVSKDKDFKELIIYGKHRTNSTKDFTVKIDAKIPKKYNGKKIYYRFLVGKNISDIGITSTLPTKNPESFNIAFCSCSNYPAGYFSAYKEMANNKKIDLVLHLGDYLYEYGSSGYASDDAIKMERIVSPSHEVLSLSDYRKRHSTYKKDKDLQLLHSKKPMIAVWDDHEITNDSWKEGGENHSPNEGSYKKRKKNAIQAYFEWMPIREKGIKNRIWRNFTVGNLINLMMLDTRSAEREKQLDIEKYFKKLDFDEQRFFKDLQKPRKLLGKNQLKWIKEKNNNEFKWSIFGQQILIGPKYLPEIFKKADKNTFPEYLHKYLSLAGTKIPYNTDQWDGYPLERQKFYKTIKSSQSNLVLAGDSHNSWVSNLYNDNRNFVGIEIGAPSISSPNFVDIFGDLVDSIDKSFISSNNDLIWTNGKNKGYVELEVFSEYVDVNFHFVSSVKTKSYKKLKPVSFRVSHNKPLS